MLPALIACAAERPARLPPSRQAPIVALAGVVLQSVCPQEPRILLAVYDDLALLRSGSACPREEEALRAVDLDAEDRRQLAQDIELNPLLSGISGPAEFCPRCFGREADVVVVRGVKQFGRVVVIGAGSDEPPEGDLTPTQRDAALAARALVRSLERIREWLASKPWRPWNSRHLIFRPTITKRIPAESCRWPNSWPAPEGLALLLPGQSRTLATDQIPETDFAAWRARCPGYALVRSVICNVESFLSIPAQDELGKPFEAGKLK